jgi:anti-sigma regulatory factor (Ser/Thr protein kinase)
MTSVTSVPSERLLALTLPGIALSVSVARQCAGLVVANLGHLRIAREDVELLVSELAGNAVRHTVSGDGGEFRLELWWEVHGRRRVLGMAVHDQGSDGFPAVRESSPDSWSTGGRGLCLVADLAHTWGFTLCPEGGCVVWAMLASDDASPEVPASDRNLLTSERVLGLPLNRWHGPVGMGQE